MEKKLTTEKFEQIKLIENGLKEIFNFDKNISLKRRYNVIETHIILSFYVGKEFTSEFSHSIVYYTKDTDWHTNYGIKIYNDNLLIFDKEILRCPTNSSNDCSMLDNYMAIMYPDYVNDKNIILQRAKRTRKMDFNPDKFTLKFGKYNGLTISQIGKKDLRYLLWLNSDDFNDRYGNIKPSVRLYLNKK